MRRLAARVAYRLPGPAEVAAHITLVVYAVQPLPDDAQLAGRAFGTALATLPLWADDALTGVALRACGPDNALARVALLAFLTVPSIPESGQAFGLFPPQRLLEERAARLRLRQPRLKPGQDRLALRAEDRDLPLHVPHHKGEGSL